MVLYGVVINTPTTSNIANLDFFMYRLPNHAPQFIFPSLTMSMFIVGNVIGLQFVRGFPYIAQILISLAP